MQVIDSLIEMRKLFKNDKILECSITHIKDLDTDPIAEAVEFYTERLYSNYLHYKVESHGILTKALFLMMYYGVYVDFVQKAVFIETDNGQEIRVNYIHHEALSMILYTLLETTKDSNEQSYRYSDYRQATRSITDHLEESDQPRVIWKRLLKLTTDYEIRGEHYEYD